MSDRPGLIALLLIAPMLFIGSANAELFKWKGDDGRIFYSDKPPLGEKKAETLKFEIHRVSFDKETITKNPSAHSKAVVMYSASWCGVCKKAQAYFAAEGIAYKDYDIENSRKGRSDYKKLKGTGVPIIMVDDERLDGFSQRRFEKAYQG
ncbi:MAG: glutaredoxin family protein [Thiotrichales bacterium]|nr:glutaredoxin family protein [Thiotrichales bacterium]